MLLSYAREGRVSSGSVSFLPYLAGIVVAPNVAMVVTIFLATVAAMILQRRPAAKIFFNAAQFAIAAAAACFVLAPWGRLYSGLLSDIWYLLAFCIAALLWMLLNASLVVGAISLTESRSYSSLWKKVVGATALYDVMAFPIIVLLAWAYVNHGWLWLVGVVVPLLGLRQLYKKSAQLEKTSAELLQLMVAAIEARDPYTSGHSRRVAAYSRHIARSAHVPARTVERIAAAALLHDVGKIHEVYAPILRKPGRLTAEETAIIQTHPVKSAELVAKVTQLKDLIPSVRGHHERWDGRGYPDGLLGSAIPLGARIIALADTIDAMRTSRPYRSALPIESIRTEISRGRGSQFDPQLVDALLTANSWAQLHKAVRRFESLGAHELAATDDDEIVQETPVSAAAH